MSQRRRRSLPARLGQLDLDVDLRRKPVDGKHGGFRPGAGRPRGCRVSHARREEFKPSQPLHVVLRMRPEVAVLRRRDAFHVVRGCIARCHRDHFRVVEFSIMSNHVHLVVEADGPGGLSRGVQGLAAAIAKRINCLLGRRGRVFDDRYFVRVLRAPRQVRACLLYVLQNERHHTRDRRTWRAFDPFSSAMSFDGWATPLPVDEGWQRRSLAAPRATAPPTVWLLTTGWKRRGLIDLDEAPSA